MPFTTADVEKHTKKATTAKLKRTWRNAANDHLQDCIDDGGTDETCAPSAIKLANGIIAKEIGETEMPLTEQETKKVGNRTHQRGDFLVVGDEDKVTTWHLPVKIRGVPNHGLAGGAWAALFSAKGFRGQPYAGPDKTAAKRKLRALYRAEEWDVPTSEADIAEFCYLEEEKGYRSFSATSFADLMSEEHADEMASEVRERTWQFQDIIRNIMFSVEVTDKPAAIRNLANEFADIVDGMMESVENAESTAELTEVRLCESARSSAVMLTEIAESGTPSSPRDVLEIDLVLITPGFGNAEHNHYYPADMLHEYADRFVGAKMYPTDHRSEEKSAGSEVARIESIVGFTEEGAPIGRAVIFDPDFAEATRNRAKGGVLDSLECSILASGLVREGQIDGKDANIVESITTVESVDFVTKAGAGGRALALAESATPANPGGDELNERQIAEETETLAREEVLQETGSEEQADPVLETGKVKALLTESNLPKAAQVRLVKSEYADEDAVKAAISQEAAYLENINPKPEFLSEEKVKAVLAESNLPAAAIEWLVEGQYANEAQLDGAVEKAVQRIKTITGSGRVFGQGASTTVEQETSEADYDEGYAAIAERYGLTPVKKKEA